MNRSGYPAPIKAQKLAQLRLPTVGIQTLIDLTISEIQQAAERGEMLIDNVFNMQEINTFLRREGFEVNDFFENISWGRLTTPNSVAEKMFSVANSYRERVRDTINQINNIILGAIERQESEVKIVLPDDENIRKDVLALFNEERGYYVEGDVFRWEEPEVCTQKICKLSNQQRALLENQVASTVNLN